jgi:hydroxymethylpyrimidine pyrophosphatase-like HAD family hydrolase
MGNAPDPIKAVADYVTDTNEKDGVGKALEKFFEL